MSWTVILCDDFEREFLVLNSKVRVAIAAHISLIENFGPNLSRPYADTLSGSRYTNMKELRLSVDGGVWRLAFAFDLQRQAVVLVAGDKAGKDQKRFYKKLIKVADERFDDWLNKLKEH